MCPYSEAKSFSLLEYVDSIIAKSESFASFFALAQILVSKIKEIFLEG